MNTLKRLLRMGAIAGGVYAALLLYARRAISRHEDLVLELAEAPGSIIEIGGLRIHYVEAGAGSPVVLIHGWNGSTFDYRYTFAALSERHRVVAIDLKGYGFSARPPKGDYTHTAQAGLVCRLMDALGIERAVVVGHSMGGGVAQSLALHHPERVSRLVLVDSVTHHEFRRTRFSHAVPAVLPVVALFALRPSFRERALRYAVHDPAYVTPDTIDGHFRPLRMKGHLRAQAQQIKSRRNEEPLEPHRIRAPTLLLWGEHDRVMPIEHGRELASLIPTARLVVVPSAGHLPLAEQPAFCNRELLAFLSEGTSGDVELTTSAQPAEAPI